LVPNEFDLKGRLFVIAYLDEQAPEVIRLTETFMQKQSRH
jgi:hypothetical protein